MEQLIFLLINQHGCRQNEWFIAAQEILTLLFEVKDNPEVLIWFLISKLSQFIDDLQVQSGKASIAKKLTKKSTNRKNSTQQMEIEEGIVKLEEEYQQQVEAAAEQNQAAVSRDRVPGLEPEVQQNSQATQDKGGEAQLTLPQTASSQLAAEEDKGQEAVELFEQKLSQTLFVVSTCCLKLLFHCENI